MIHVYNGSKWTEKKFDSVEQMASKLDFDAINDDAGFRKAFNHGKNVFVFVMSTEDEQNPDSNMLFWGINAKSVEDNYWTIIDEI